MPTKIIQKKTTSAAVPTPDAGYVDLYNEGDVEKFKASSGTVYNLAAFAAGVIVANSLIIGTATDTLTPTTFAANTFPARASTGNLVAKTITDFGLSLVDDADAATARTTLGLGSSSTLNVDTDGTMAANSDTVVPSQKAVRTYVGTAVTGLLDFKGSTDCSGNPNYPAASKGDAYVVSVAGKIGGASGTPVDVGDVYFALADNAGGTQAAVGSSWDVLEHNLQGALLSANNLSDVASVPTARTNLGLGTGDSPTFNGLTLSNALTPGNGGTGISSYAVGDLLYASGATTLSKLADVATGNALLSGGIGVAPAWGKVSLTGAISGILPLANGGSGADLSATGGANQFVKQSGSGSVFTVAAILSADLTTALTTPPAIGGVTPAAGAFTDLSSTGNTTIGDASGDTLTINAGTWTLNSNVVATRAAGVLATGTTSGVTLASTYTGDVGGASTNNTLLVTTDASGANNLATLRGIRSQVVFSGSGTGTAINGTSGSVTISSTGSITTVVGNVQSLTLSNSGGATTAVGYRVAAPTLSSTGAIGTNIGFSTLNLGHATLVGTSVGFLANNITGGTVLTVGFESQVNSGTTKWGFYSSGTADNAFTGNVRIGSVVAPTVALDVTGAALISTTLGVTGIITSSGGITMADAKDIVFNTTTGTKIGTATTQKLGFWNATPIVRGTAFTQTYSTATHTVAARTLGTVTDNTGGVSAYPTIAVVTNPTFGWNSVLAPTAAEGTAINTAFTSIKAALAGIIVAINKIGVDDVNTVGVLNGLIDDLQAVGLTA